MQYEFLIEDRVCVQVRVTDHGDVLVDVHVDEVTILTAAEARAMATWVLGNVGSAEHWAQHVKEQRKHAAAEVVDIGDDE